MHTPCGIHLFKKKRTYCPICLRVERELREEDGPRVWTEKERQDRAVGGRLGKRNGTPFGLRSKEAEP